MSREYLNALWELTKRELRRKYARSYLGIAWSSLYPLLRMMLVTFLFSHVFNKGIPSYPVYYFIAYLIFEFWEVSTLTSVTALRDNKDLYIKSKLPKELFVVSRVLTAFVNFLLGLIPFCIVLLIYRITVTYRIVFFLIDLFFLVLFVIGISYFSAVVYCFFRDIRNLLSRLLMVLRYFVAMFYGIDSVSSGVRNFIIHNPPYVFIKIARDAILYNRISEGMYWSQMIVYSLLSFFVGRVVFEFNKDRVLLKL